MEEAGEEETGGTGAYDCDFGGHCWGGDGGMVWTDDDEDKVVVEVGF